MAVDQSDPVWVGIDPGGLDAFGIATISRAGEIKTHCVSCADEALEFVTSRPLGLGVDAPLWWSSGRSSDRKADQWIRNTYNISGGTVQASNSLRGAALVQGAMFVSRLRERFPQVPVTEVHPKAVAKALGGWDCKAVTSLGVIACVRDHERDACLAAIAAREGFEGRWKRDLSLDRQPSEQDPKTYWLGPVHYFWPD
jgi:predicted nuclease with RNAse H fold